jgi:hypothetical protein
MMDTAKTAYNVAEKILPSRFTGIQTANPIISAISDLEVEMIGLVPLSGNVISGCVTTPARKLLDICAW